MTTSNTFIARQYIKGWPLATEPPSYTHLAREDAAQARRAVGVKPGALAPGQGPPILNESRRDAGGLLPTPLRGLEGCEGGNFPGAKAPGFMPVPLRGGFFRHLRRRVCDTKQDVYKRVGY